VLVGDDRRAVRIIGPGDELFRPSLNGSEGLVHHGIVKNMNADVDLVAEKVGSGVWIGLLSAPPHLGSPLMKLAVLILT
jgi:hypothetical protein